MHLFNKRYYEGPKSDHFNGETFYFPKKPFKHNVKEVFKWRLFGKHPIWPRNVPVVNAEDPPDRVHGPIRVTYIGHATLLIQSSGLNILIDPHFSKRASPIKWMGFKRVQKPGLTLSKLPPIDYIFVSHDHYDHLDLASIRKIWKKDQPIIITPLGNDKIIKRAHRGMQIETLDWGEQIKLSAHIALKVLPAQHWSARTPFDRNRALWSSACFYINDKTVFFMGDSGFDHQLFVNLKNMIGKKPDIALMPIGSYEPGWLMSYAHMSPEESWTAFNILQGEKFLPIHYDVFPLGDEPYGEALPRLMQAAGEDSAKVVPLNAGEHLILECP